MINIKTFTLASLGAGITSFLMGYLFYGIIFHSDFNMNYISPPNFLSASPNLVAIFLGNMCMGMALAYIYLKWNNVTNFTSGFFNGAIIGGLMAFADNLVIFGRTTMFSLSGIVYDALILCLIGALAGGVAATIIRLLNVKHDF